MGYHLECSRGMGRTARGADGAAVVYVGFVCLGEDEVARGGADFEAKTKVLN